jgi:hypothetical protein
LNAPDPDRVDDLRTRRGVGELIEMTLATMGVSCGGASLAAMKEARGDVRTGA